MYGKLQEHLQAELQQIEADGLYKRERIITGEQGAEITVEGGQKVLNFCSNNCEGDFISSAILRDSPKILLVW